MSTEHKAYEQILTDPDVLADYTCEFFGPEGPYPVEDEQPAYGAPQAPADAEDFWKDFGGAADRDPQNAWRYLNAAQQNPEVFRQKLLVME